MFSGVCWNQLVYLSLCPSVRPVCPCVLLCTNTTFCQSAGGGIKSHAETALVSAIATMFSTHSPIQRQIISFQQHLIWFYAFFLVESKHFVILYRSSMQLTLSHKIQTFNDPEETVIWKHCGKRRKCGSPAFSHNIFLSIKKKNNHFSNIKFVICKHFHCGKGLNPSVFYVKVMPDCWTAIF